MKAENQSNMAAQFVSSAGISGPLVQLESLASEPRIVAVLANYGRGNDVYLRKLLAEFRSMRLRFDLHVLTNMAKDLGPDVTVHVGLPTRNPRSLPFGHRRLFAENLTKADYFIYCEDDTLITERNIRAFLEVNRVLNSDEIPGFLRVEHATDGELVIESAHGPYRWSPSSVVQRGLYSFAAFTNVHSAVTIASRLQVQKAIESGGFLVAPHLGRVGMLESAASDLYTQCGLKRLICVSRIEDFLVPHLSSKNSLKWGLRHDEFLEQTRALQRIDQDGSWKGALLEVETRMPRGCWSKNLYEHPDTELLSRIPRDAKTVLSVGSGWGATEEVLAKQGRQVTGLPVDAVFADCLRRRGIEAVQGPIEAAIARLGPRQFDAVLMLDVIHLLPDPAEWLSMIRPLVSRTGVVLATVPRTFDPLRAVWCLRGEPAYVFPKRFAESCVQRVTRARLAKWFKMAGMTADIVSTCNTPTRIGMLLRMRGFGDRVLADKLIVQARPKARM